MLEIIQGEITRISEMSDGEIIRCFSGDSLGGEYE